MKPRSRPPGGTSASTTPAPFGADWRHLVRQALDRLGGVETVAAARAAAELGRRVAGADAGADALLTALRLARLPGPDQAGAEAWLDLPSLDRLALVLLEIEVVPVARAARVIAVPEDELLGAHQRASQRLGLPEPLKLPACPGAATVARLYRTDPEEAEVAIQHLSACGPCSLWHSRRAERRAELARLAPWCGATGLGYVLDPRSV